jgi:diguanylate cyclase (GGDEF)-like protein
VRSAAAPLGTRVARRVLGLFLVCALLPVLVTILGSYARVQSALVDQRVAQLGQAAEAFGTTLLERLYLADQLARSLAATGAASHAVDRQLARYFGSIVVLRPGAPPRVLLGDVSNLPADANLEPEMQPHLAAGEAVILTPAAGGGRSVWLLRAIMPADPGRGLVAVELNPAYLWGDTDELPYLTSVCVLDWSHRPLHCSAELPATALGHLREGLALGPAGHFSWAAGEGRGFSAYRELFLQAKFRAASWPIVVTQPADHALAPARAVAGLVVPIVALGLLLAAFLGLVQVRRTMGPLAQLTAATEAIAARRFGTRVEVVRDDEFGALAAALNTMSERLGRQFHALGALAQIDSVILSQVDIDRIVTIVLGRLHEVVPAAVPLLLLAEDGAPERFRAHAVTPDAAAWNRRTIVVGGAELERLVAAPDGVRIDPGTAATALAPALAELGLASLLVLPILLERRLAGMLVVGYRGAQHADDDELQVLRDLGDRVAVALATAARDRELYRRAHYDPLTQLPNRLLFLDELGRELARAERQGRIVALLFIDLDGFSQVNDTLGHAAGDQLLVHAASRLRACVRKADLVARLGGDEFTIVLPDLRAATDAATVAQHAIKALSEPFRIGHGETFVAASVGVALFPVDGTTADDLLQHADMAMYRAKEKGRGTHVFFEEGMNREAQRRLVLDRELRRALEEEQFVVHYQPQLDLRSRRIVGAEALLRWMHPERGLTAPGPFISFAEESGLIERIGEWVLDAACAQFTAWRAAGLAIDHVSVNVSPRQFRRRDFPEIVARALERHRMHPHTLRLEITESVLVDDSGAADATLARLSALGTPLELDDFGTGYSSLAYLQRLPVATIKLDRSFIRGIAESDNAQAIVRAAIAMVHALGKEVVAEGVETAEQLHLLRDWDCDAVQGYYLSKPLPASEFARSVHAPPVDARPAA